MRKFSSGVGVGLNFKRRGEVLLFTYLPPIPSLITKHILLFVLSEGGGVYPSRLVFVLVWGKNFCWVFVVHFKLAQLIHSRLG